MTDKNEQQPKMVKTTFLLTIEHPEGQERGAREYLEDFGTVEEYHPPTVQASTPSDKGQAFDAYGNPYDKNAKRSNHCDAYGNPYNKSGEQEKPADPNVRRDAYGNPY